MNQYSINHVINENVLIHWIFFWYFVYCYFVLNECTICLSCYERRISAIEWNQAAHDNENLNSKLMHIQVRNGHIFDYEKDQNFHAIRVLWFF